MSGPRRASIIIRTKDEAAAIGTTLTAVFAQDVQPHEVIVIDSGSRDDTLEIASRFPVKIMTISPEEWSYSRALNRAAAAATGDALVCLSAHCTPLDNRWLGRLLAHLDDPRVAASWGHEDFPGKPPAPYGPPRRFSDGSYTSATRRVGFSNANGCIRRSLWERMPFDEALPAAEDKAWGRDIMRQGYDVVLDLDARVLHAHHEGRRAIERTHAIEAGLYLIFGDSELTVRHTNHLAFLSLYSNLIRPILRRDFEAALRSLQRLPSKLSSVIGSYLFATMRLRFSASRRIRQIEVAFRRPSGKTCYRRCKYAVKRLFAN